MAFVDPDKPVNAPLDTALVTAVGKFVQWCIGPNITIVRGWTNAVSRPRPPYVMITPMGQTWNSQTRRQYTPDTEDVTKGTLTVSRSLSRLVQLDFYGIEAQGMCQTVATLAQDLAGCSVLQDYGITPLYVSDPQELTFAEGNEQAMPRWMVELHIQPGPQFQDVAVRLDFFDEATVGVRPV